MKIINVWLFQKCSTIPIKFAVMIVWLKVYIICSQFDNLTLHSRSQLRLKLYNCLTCTIIAISRTVFKLWCDGRLLHDILAHALVDDLDCDAKWVGKGKKSVLLSRQPKQATNIKLAITVSHFVLDLYFENAYTAWPCFLSNTFCFTSISMKI